MIFNHSIVLALFSAVAATASSSETVSRRALRETVRSRNLNDHEKLKCTAIPMYSDNLIFQDAVKTVGEIGNAVSEIPVFDVATETHIGDFTVLAVELGEGGKSFEEGFITLFKEGSEKDIDGSIMYAGPSPVDADSSITGGTGSYACASGILKFQGFENDRFLFDMITCGEFCDPYNIDDSTDGAVVDDSSHGLTKYGVVAASLPVEPHSGGSTTNLGIAAFAAAAVAFLV